MPNKEALKKRNRQLRHNITKRNQEIVRKKELVRKEKEAKEQEKLNDPKYTYPEFILTLQKRLKRVDPWNGVINMKTKQMVLVIYFKLKQMGISNLKIVSNNIHSWIEFEYFDRWWIFDLLAVRDKSLGDPIKKKGNENHSTYTSFSRVYTSMDRYIEDFEDEIYIDKDEAKILAMEDAGLNTIGKINYH